MTISKTQDNSYLLTREEIDFLNEYLWDHQKMDDHDTLEQCKTVVQSSKELNYEAGEALGYLNLGYYHLYTTSPQNAVEGIQQALAIYERKNDIRGKERCVNALGIVYRRLGLLDRALDYFTQTHAVALELADFERKAVAENNIGAINHQLKRYEEALEYFLKSFNTISSYWKQGDRSSSKTLLYLSSCYSNIGDALIHLERYSEALDYLQKGLAFSKEYEVKVSQMTILGQMGILYDKTENHDQAESYLIASYDLAEVVEDPLYLIEILLYLGRHYNQLNQDPKALIYLENAERKILKHENYVFAQEVFELLYKIHKRSESHEKALHYLEMLHEEEMKVHNREISEKISLLTADFKYQQALKEKEIIQRKNEELKQSLIQLKQARVKADFHANHDSLTELPNRRMFRILLGQEIHNARRRKGKFALLFMDLNGFKSVNDEQGHDAGDAVLIEVSRRFKSVLRQNDILSRFGGDEFLLYVSDTKDLDSCNTVCCKLRKCLESPIDVNDKKVELGISIGISIYPDHGDQLDVLIKDADQKMYKDKVKQKKGERGYCP